MGARGGGERHELPSRGSEGCAGRVVTKLTNQTFGGEHCWFPELQFGARLAGTARCRVLVPARRGQYVAPAGRGKPRQSTSSTFPSSPTSFLLSHSSNILKRVLKILKSPGITVHVSTHGMGCKRGVNLLAVLQSVSFDVVGVG